MPVVLPVERANSALEKGSVPKGPVDPKPVKDSRKMLQWLQPVKMLV